MMKKKLGVLELLLVRRSGGWNSGSLAGVVVAGGAGGGGGGEGGVGG